MLGVAIAGVVPGAAGSQISPGALSRAHAAIDGSGGCLDCHRAKSGVDAALCASCHATLGKRVERGLGLHARPEYQRCERCHIEHQGREFALVFWGEGGEAGFDHALTGFALEGAHAAQNCRGCHALEYQSPGAPREPNGVDPSRSFLGLVTNCAACHDDVHRGQFEGRACSDCHGSSRFAGADRFRHDESGFPLTGLHAKVSCGACHAEPAAAATGSPATTGSAKRYRGLSRSCSGCHSDPHRRRLGDDCSSCHSTNGWRLVESAGFDHGRTRYPLSGRHSRVPCSGCHRAGVRVALADYEICSSCHVDAHRGQFASRAGGGRCDDCHSTAGFSPSTFDARRHQETRYPLLGAHRAVACAECHRESGRGGARGAGAAWSFRAPSLDCQACHADPHPAPVRASGTDETPQARRFGCGECHVVEAWREVKFDHARTTYPLEGAHGRAGCIACHAGSEARRRGGGSPAVPFAGPVSFVAVDRSCTACHEDTHFGQFADREVGSRTAGESCASCHRIERWSEIDFVHDRDTEFALEGGHRAVPCAGCHSSERVGGRSTVRYRPLDRRCAACHGSAVFAAPPS